MLYAVFDVSKLMKWCTRSTEEIFSLFISIAFAVDAGRDAIKSKSLSLSISPTLATISPWSIASGPKSLEAFFPGGVSALEFFTIR